MRTLKVYIRMHDGSISYGYVHLKDEERLQDLLNDERSFIPVNVHKSERGRGDEDVYVMSMINKSWLQSIEEV